MKTASVVFYSDPVSGSMQAAMSDRMLARQDFAGIHGQGVKGDAEPALRRGEGDDKAMGLGLIHGPHSPDNAPTGNPYLIGMLPAELGMHMDMATGSFGPRRRCKGCAGLYPVRAVGGHARGMEFQGHRPLLTLLSGAHCPLRERCRAGCGHGCPGGHRPPG